MFNRTLVYQSVNIDVTIKDFYTVKYHTLCFIMFAIVHACMIILITSVPVLRSKLHSKEYKKSREI